MKPQTRKSSFLLLALLPLAALAFLLAGRGDATPHSQQTKDGALAAEAGDSQQGGKTVPVAKTVQPGKTVRGITISTHGIGKDWGTDVIVPTYEAIREVGSNWVAIHPYAGIRGDGTIRPVDLDVNNPPEHVVRPIREAHAQGLQILIKPHLAYWGSRFQWRGEITFDDEVAWERFWKGYTDWIVALARISSDADAFVVGTELDLTLEHEERWRKLIAKVRQESGAPLTYAANWPDYQKVPFWDALDVVGIQAYFPLAEKGQRSEATIREGWRRQMDTLRAYSQQTGKEILFTELGYNRSFAAAAEPWEYHTDGPEAEALQSLCMRIALEAIEAEPKVVGSFLWKWFPEPYPVGRNFQLATPAMKDTIRSAWSG